jgi:hypothetical protein
MTPDIGALLRRDHNDLENGLGELARPLSDIAEIRTTLDGVRLGLSAHVEAEDIVLYQAFSRFVPAPRLRMLVAQGRAAHLTQEGALSALVSSRPGSSVWRDRAAHLHGLIREHAAQEETQTMPLLRDYAPADVYHSLAGRFATERLRQLAMLQPSAPIYSYAMLANL